MLESDGMLDMGEDAHYGAPSRRQYRNPTSSAESSLDSAQLLSDAAGSGGSVFPLVLRRPFHIAHATPGAHTHPRALSYHMSADDAYPLHHYHHNHHNHHYQHHAADGDDSEWHHHHHHSHAGRSASSLCTCGGAATGSVCDRACPSSSVASTSGSGSGASSSDTGSGFGAVPHTHHHLPPQPQQQSQSPEQPGHSLQHLLAVGSRQWGGGGWWDGRGLLKVKIYDFAVYADTAKAAHALHNASATAAASGSPPGPPSSDWGPPGPSSGSAFSRSFHASNPGGASGAARRLSLESCEKDSRGPSASGVRVPVATAASPCGASPAGGAAALASGSAARAAEMLVPAGSGVEASLTIRACRNLPLAMLSQEFERILQRRHVKAGGQTDDPAMRELLSYFSRERLPPHVVTPPPLPGCGGGGEDTAAVRKGAAITFSRSSSGELVTEAGGHVLGRVRSPALAEALFDLYLGDQPVSKRAKTAAGAALLRLVDPAATPPSGGPSGTTAPPYRYQLQAGERLLCPPGVALGGARGQADVSGCLLELP